MAACTHAVSTASTTNASSYASGSFTPAAGDLLVAFVTATGTVAAGSMTDSQNLGWSKVTTALKASSADTLYCFVANKFAAASSMTVTFDCTGDAATGAVIQVVRVASMLRKGPLAIRQSAVSSNQTSGTPGPSFAASALTGNVTLGLVGNATNPATMTTPTNWTEQNDTGYGTPTTGAEYVTRDSGFTGTTITWGSSSASAFGAIIVELDTSSAPTMSTPTPFNWRCAQVDQNAQTTGNISVFFPNPTLANNGLFLLLQTGGAAVFSGVADDQSQSWTNHGTTVTSGQKFEVWYKANSAAGVRKVTISRSSGTISYPQYILFEAYNTDASAPIDVISTMASDSGTAVSWGNQSVTYDGSLVVSWAGDVTASDNLNGGTSFTAGTSGTLIYCDSNAGTIVQTQPADAQGAFAPAATVCNTDAWSGLSLVLKGISSSTGTAPSATDIRVHSIRSWALGASTTSPHTFRMPVVGNLLVLAYIGQPSSGGSSAILTSGTLASVSLSQTGTDASNTGIGIGQQWRAENVTPSATATGSLTVDPSNPWTGTGGFHSICMLYDIVNAATSPYDTSANTSGKQTSSGNLSTVTITPTAQPGLTILGGGPLNAHTAAECATPSTYLYDGYYQTTTDGGDTTIAECDMWAHTVRHTSTSSLTYVFTTINNSGGVQEWAVVAGAYKEASTPASLLPGRYAMTPLLVR